MNYYDAGSLAKIPGVSISAAVQPKQISVRIRRAAQRMIRVGALTGGYASKANKLAEAVARANGATMVRARYGTYVEFTAIPAQAREQVAELIIADHAAWLLESNADAARWPQNAGYYASQRKRLTEDAERNAALARAGALRTHQFRDSKFADRALKLVAQYRSPLEIEHNNNVAALLDGDQPITIQ